MAKPIANRRNILAARQDETVTLASDDALPAVPLVYDYDQIAPEHRDQVRTDTAYVKAGMQRTSKEMLEWGNRLNRIKTNTEHGQFGAILETELGFTSSRLPQMWMAAAKRLADKSENFSQLPASALYLLGSESTPDEAIEKIGQRIDAGEQLTLKDVETTVAELKRPAPYTLTLDETIALIWSQAKQGFTLGERLQRVKTHNQSWRYTHLINPGQQIDPGIFQTAWARVMDDLEKQIENTRAQVQQELLYQQRTLADAAAEPAPEPSHPRIPQPSTTFGGILRGQGHEKPAQVEPQPVITPEPVFTPAIMRQVVAMPVTCPECGEVTDLHEDGVAYACDECGYGHPKPAHGEPETVDMRAVADRLHRINQLRITFARCLEAFSEYSELTGDFSATSVPKNCIQVMQLKLSELANILEES